MALRSDGGASRGAFYDTALLEKAQRFPEYRPADA